MWDLSEGERKVVREFIEWLSREAPDYDICVHDSFDEFDPIAAYHEPQVLAAYVRYREVLSENNEQANREG